MKKNDNRVQTGYVKNMIRKETLVILSDSLVAVLFNSSHYGLLLFLLAELAELPFRVAVVLAEICFTLLSGIDLVYIFPADFASRRPSHSFFLFPPFFFAFSDMVNFIYYEWDV